MQVNGNTGTLAQGISGTSITSLVNAITSCRNQTLSNEQWFRLCRFLRTDPDTTAKVMSSVENPLVSQNDLLLILLHEWKRKVSDTRGVEDLIDMFKQMGCSDIASHLEEMLEKDSQASAVKILNEETTELMQAQRKSNPGSEGYGLTRVGRQKRSSRKSVILEELRGDRQKLKITTIITLLIALLTLVAVGFVIFRSFFDTPATKQKIIYAVSSDNKQDSKASTQIIGVTVKWFSSTERTIIRCPKPPVRLAVDALQYVIGMMETGSKTPSCLNLRFKNCTKWVTTSDFQFSETVVLKLSGCLELPTLLHVFSSFPNVQSIKFEENNIQRDCNYPLISKRFTRYELSKVRILEFDKTISCKNMFKMMELYFRTPLLKTLIVRNMNLSVEHIEFLKLILIKQQYSLTDLGFWNTSFQVEVFNDLTWFVFTDVTYLRIDSNSNTPIHINWISSNLFKTFPHVKVFKSSTFLNWNQFQSLLQFQKLECIDISVEVPSNQAFSFEHFTMHWQYIKTGSINLKFENQTKCTVTHSYVIERYSDFEIKSNCRLEYL